MISEDRVRRLRTLEKKRMRTLPERLPAAPFRQWLISIDNYQSRMELAEIIGFTDDRLRKIFRGQTQTVSVAEVDRALCRWRGHESLATIYPEVYEKEAVYA